MSEENKVDAPIWRFPALSPKAPEPTPEPRAVLTCTESVGCYCPECADEDEADDEFDDGDDFEI